MTHTCFINLNRGGHGESKVSFQGGTILMSEQITQYEAIKDIATVDSLGRGHRHDGKFMSTYEMDMVAANEVTIRSYIDAVDVAPLATVAEPEVTHFKSTITDRDGSSRTLRFSIDNSKKAEATKNGDNSDALPHPTLHLVDTKDDILPTHQERKSWTERFRGSKLAKVAASVVALAGVGTLAHFTIANDKSPMERDLAKSAQEANLPGNYEHLGGVRLIGSNESVAAQTATPPQPPSALQQSMDYAPNAANVHFYANDTTGHKFGPEVAVRDADGLKTQFFNELGRDPARMEAEAEYMGLYSLDPASRVAKIKEYMSNPNLWKQDMDTIVQKFQTAQKIEVIPFTGQYVTDYQQDLNGDGVPEVIVGYEKSMVGQDIMVVTAADGSVFRFKLPCDFQPVTANQLPTHVAPVIPKAPVAQPVPGPNVTVPAPAETTTTTPNTVPPTTTTTTKKPPTTTTTQKPPTTTTTQKPPTTTTTQKPPTTTTTLAPGPKDTTHDTQPPGETTPTVTVDKPHEPTPTSVTSTPRPTQPTTPPANVPTSTEPHNGRGNNTNND